MKPLHEPVALEPDSYDAKAHFDIHMARCEALRKKNMANGVLEVLDEEDDDGGVLDEDLQRDEASDDDDSYDSQKTILYQDGATDSTTGVHGLDADQVFRVPHHGAALE